MKRKVFHIISHLDIGGAEKVAFNIAISANPLIEYHIVEVIKSNSDYSQHFISDIRNNNITIHRSCIHHNKVAILLFPFWFLLVFLRYKPQVIHTHTEVPDLSVFLFYKLFGWLFPKTDYVRTIHNNQLWNQWNKIGEKVEHFFQTRGKNIAISKSTHQSYKNKYGQNCPIIYNGVPIPNKSQTFSKLIQGKINVIFAGRLEYQKGIPVLVEVIKRLNNDSRFYFHIIGKGSMKDELLMGLKDCANFNHYDSIFQLSEYMGSFDYLFMPSEFEGLALMPIEASLSETPAIINSCVGLEETMPDDWKLKVKNNDIEGFVNIFNSLPQLDYNSLQKSAFTNACHKFSIKKMQQEYEKIYQHEI